MFIVNTIEQSEETTEQGTKDDAEYIGDEGIQMYAYTVWSIVCIDKVQLSFCVWMQFVSEQATVLIVTS